MGTTRVWRAGLRPACGKAPSTTTSSRHGGWNWTWSERGRRWKDGIVGARSFVFATATTTATPTALLTPPSSSPRLRSIPKSTLMVESYVAKSVTLGGNPQMTREVLSHELESELSSTSKLLFLHNVDHELHAAYSSTEDYFETEVLHG